VSGQPPVILPVLQAHLPLLPRRASGQP
jgi:hypothetical protein